MTINADNYQTIILDLDGTLYYQRPVRLFMALELAFFYGTHPWRYKELKALSAFRKLREDRAFTNNDNFYELQIAHISKTYKIPARKVEDLIDKWMQDRPLRLVRFFADKRLISMCKNWHDSGKTIVVYSDYPTKEKLSVIGLKPDYQFYSCDEEIACMKPAPKGLINILKITKTAPKKALFIGDRYSKDGLCAKGAGVDYVILPKNELKRI
jgi:FMN phosphatase YigB (HAD superfamily)